MTVDELRQKFAISVGELGHEWIVLIEKLLSMWRSFVCSDCIWFSVDFYRLNISTNEIMHRRPDERVTNSNLGSPC